MAENNTNNNAAGWLKWIFPILLVVGLMSWITSIKNGNMCVFAEHTQPATIDKIQKDYHELEPGINSATTPIVVGDYEITGTAKSSLITPYSKTPCIYYSYQLTEIYEEKEKDYTDHWVWKEKKRTEPIEKKAIPFNLDDGSGVLMVDPEYARYIGRLEENNETIYLNKYHHQYSDQRDVAEKHEESYMPVDVPITVLGTVYADNGNLFIKKSPSSYLIVSRNDHEAILNELEKISNNSQKMGIIFIILGGIPSFIWVVLIIRRRIKKS